MRTLYYLTTLSISAFLLIFTAACGGDIKTGSGSSVEGIEAAENFAASKGDDDDNTSTVTDWKPYELKEYDPGNDKDVNSGILRCLKRGGELSYIEQIEIFRQELVFSDETIEYNSKLFALNAAKTNLRAAPTKVGPFKTVEEATQAFEAAAKAEKEAETAYYNTPDSAVSFDSTSKTARYNAWGEAQATRKAIESWKTKLVDVAEYTTKVEEAWEALLPEIAKYEVAVAGIEYIKQDCINTYLSST